MFEYSNNWLITLNKVLTWAIQGAQIRPTKFSKIEQMLTCFSMCPYKLENSSAGLHCVSQVQVALGPLLTSCLWSPLLSPDSLWVGKFHAWFCPPTSHSPKSIGCNYPLPAPEHFILLMSLTLWHLPRTSVWLCPLKEASWALPDLPRWQTLVSTAPGPSRFHFTKPKFGKPQWDALHHEFKAVPY